MFKQADYIQDNVFFHIGAIKNLKYLRGPTKERSYHMSCIHYIAEVIINTSQLRELYINRSDYGSKGYGRYVTKLNGWNLYLSDLDLGGCIF